LRDFATEGARRTDGPAPAAPRWAHRRGSFLLSEPLLVGVLNVTPDSFSDGGRYLDPERAWSQASRMIEQGAAVIDVGGESTRPGATPVEVAEEIDRVLPVVERIRARSDVPISIDTRRALVANAALEAGADIVNDVSALSDRRMAEVVAASGAGLVLMHMRGTPATMQRDPRYRDVAAEVTDELGARVAEAVGSGITPERIVVDPGIGFGKTFQHNLELIASLSLLSRLGRPIMLGVSRKAFLGAIVGAAVPEERAIATAAACVMGYLNGARIFRVHDLDVVGQALRVAVAIDGARQTEA
jgi:dihydropteroate synthase